MIVLGVKLENTTPLDNGARKWMRGITKEVLRHSAEYWHRRILVKHFAPNARFAYRYEPRNKNYVEETKKEEGVGEGKTAMLQFQGKSRRFMLAFVQITASSKRATVTMRPPFYFKNPFIGTRTDPETGRQITITRQPDKGLEVTAQTNKDKQEVRDAAARETQRLLTETRPLKSSVIRG